MIELYSGTPGSGKSLNACNIAREYYKKGRPVITNYDIKFFGKPGRGKGFHLRVYNEDYTPQLLYRISEVYGKRLGRKPHEEEILLILDEAQLLFNTRNWNDGTRKGWVSFFTQHRKLGYHIVLIAQFDLMLDKQIRALIEYEHVHRKVKNIGYAGKLVNILLGGAGFVDVCIYKPMNMKLGSKFISAKQELFEMYNSYTTF